MVEKTVSFAFKEETVRVETVSVDPNIVEKIVSFAFSEETVLIQDFGGRATVVGVGALDQGPLPELVRQVMSV